MQLVISSSVMAENNYKFNELVVVIIKAK